MRKLAALLLLAVIAVIVWAGAQWFVHRNDITATVVFETAPKLRAGDPVKEGDRTVGRIMSIAPLGDRQAVTLRLNGPDRRAIVTDSLFDAKDHALVVDNTVAIGRPIDNGAILEARDDSFARWVSKQVKGLKPHVADVQKRVAAAEAELRKSNRLAEAQKLKERFERWLSEIGR